MDLARRSVRHEALFRHVRPPAFDRYLVGGDATSAVNGPYVDMIRKYESPECVVVSLALCREEGSWHGSEDGEESEVVRGPM